MAEGQTNDPGAPGFAIGASLKEARQRLGMGVKEAEERTKIRARYLRALEAEDWEALPGSAYVRGFLRTYGSLLGLDGGLLADEYRRRYEVPSSAGSSIGGDPMRPARARASSGSGGPSRGLLAGGVLVVIVLLLIVLGVLGGDDEKPDGIAAPTVERSGKKGERNGGGDRNERLRLAITPKSPMTVCLVSGGDALIDSQVLAAGASEKFGGERKYRLDLADAGEIKVAVDGEDSEIAGTGEQSFEITSSGVEEISYAGPACP